MSRPPDIEDRVCSFKEAAELVLERSGRLMSVHEIVQTALEWGILSTHGRTPGATLSAQLNRDITEKGESSRFRKFGNGNFSVTTKFAEHIRQAVLSPYEQENGMVLFPASALKYIPEDQEANWLEVRESSIPNSGMGLFTKRPLTAGTAICGYRGNMEDINRDDEEHDVHSYGISVNMPDGTVKMINGIDSSGNVLSFGPRANDAGPWFQNCELSEYREKAGQVFLETKFNIPQGREIFVCYGPSYWGFDGYPRYPTLAQYGLLPVYAAAYRLAEKGDDRVLRAHIESNRILFPQPRQRLIVRVKRSLLPETVKREFEERRQMRQLERQLNEQEQRNQNVCASVSESNSLFDPRNTNVN
jgi:hypothetical protein